MAETMGEWEHDGDGSGDTAPYMERYIGGRNEEEEEKPHEWGGERESDEEDGMGLMEAFENFNLKATKRLQELLSAAEARLYGESDIELADDDEPPPNTPSYVLMSDDYRHVRPPQFRFWRQSFPYLQLIGRSSFDEAPDEHIQIRPPPPCVSPRNQDQHIEWMDGKTMEVVGQAFHLQIDTSDPPQEELIIADGEMEEVLEEDHGGSESETAAPLSGVLLCPSPRASRIEEAIDRITIDCYSAFVQPAIGSIFRYILERQQHDLRVARENHEEAVKLAQEADIAYREELRRRAEKEAHDKALYEAAVAKAVEEERAREEQRREELLRQQREENDEEEIKIRTLAYTHTREWYQPNKKCFSHRGRQLSYLKPVRKAQAEQEDHVQGDLSDGAITLRQKAIPSKPIAKEMRHPRRVSSPSVADVTHAEEQNRSSEESVLSDSRPQSSPSQKAAIQKSPRVVLPLLTQRSQNVKLVGSKDDRVVSPASITKLSSTTVAPSRVYSTSPYHIPPPILKTEVLGDVVVTGRKRTKRYHGEIKL